MSGRARPKRSGTQTCRWCGPFKALVVRRRARPLQDRGQGASHRVRPPGLRERLGAFAGGVSDQAARPAPGSPAGRTANAEAQAAPTTTTAGVAGSGAADAPEHSDTNVQEKGVDEPNTTKTDGTHLYTVVNGTLYVFTVDDGIPTQAGTLALGRSGNQQLLL